MRCPFCDSICYKKGKSGVFVSKLCELNLYKCKECRITFVKDDRINFCYAY